MNIYENKMFNALKDVLGGEQKAFSYQKEDAENKLDILFAKSSPSRNYLTASTLGLVNRTTGYKDKNTQKDIRAEIIMASYGGTDMIGKILSTIGIGIYTNNLRYGYGTVLKGVLKGYYPQSDMKHIFLMLPPPIWQQSFKVVEADENNIIAFLYALPISQAECDYMAKNGIDELQNKFVEVNIDMFDLNRKSVF